MPDVIAPSACPPGPAAAGLCAVLPDLSLLHAQLLRFAKAQLRNAAQAEDAVSEAVLAALSAPQTFATATQATAWVFGILRHKVVDQMRQQRRESPAGDLSMEGEAEGPPLPPGVGQAGAISVWNAGPAAMNDPEQACRQAEFMAMLSSCCQGLSTLQAQAFELRDVWGLEASAIAQRLGVTEGHVWVLLHRARQKLRSLVPQAWPMHAD